MSAILDALRRRKDDDRSDGRDDHATARTDAVLATLGYPRAQPGAGPSRRALFFYGAGAVAVGAAILVGVTLFVTPDRPSGGARALQTAAMTSPRPSGAPVQSGRSDSKASAGATAPKDDVASSAQQQLARDAAAAPQVARESQPRTVRQASRAAGHAQTAQPPAQAQPSPPAVPVARAAPTQPAVPTPPAEDHFALALTYQRAGDLETALTHYRELLEQNQAGAEVYNNLGLLYHERGQFEDAATQFQRAIALDTRSAKAHNNLGVALMRLNRPGAAAGEFRVALATDPRNVESLVNLALLQKAAGRSADARDLLQRAVALDPRNAGSHYNLAVVADESGQTALAIEHYRAFLKFGAVTHGELAVRVRTRLATLTGG
jgi:Tfp pilus assembly protein PilF